MAGEPWAWVPPAWASFPPPVTDELAGLAGATAPAGPAPIDPAAAAAAGSTTPADAGAPGAAIPPVTDELAGLTGAAPTWPPPEWSGAALAPAGDPASADGVVGAGTPGVALAAAAAPDLGSPAPGAPPAGDPVVDPPAAGAAPGLSDVEAEAVRLSNLTPEQFAIEQFRRTQTATNDQQAKELRASEQNLRDAADNARIYRESVEKAQAASEQLNADALAASQMKVDPDAWFGNLSTGRKIASVIAAIVGGLASPHTGGRNLGAEALMRHIDQDIDAQKFNIQNAQAGIDKRRGIVANMFEQGGDLFRAAEASRIASYEQVAQGIQNELSNYDPQGATAMRLAESLREIRSRQASAVIKYQEQFQKQAADLAKLDLERQRIDLEDRKVLETQRSNLTDERIRSFEATLKERNVANDEAKTKADLARLDEEKAKTQIEDVRKFGIGGPAKAVVDDAGKLDIIAAGSPLTQKDNTPFKARSEGAAAALSKQMAASGEVVDIIDEILAIRDRVGGESSIFNSDDKQRLKVLQNKIVILAKSGTEGMSSDEDMKKLAGAAGADDVASFRARAAGLEKGRERVLTELNRSLKSNQYTGPAIDFPSRFGSPPKKSGDEDRVKELLKKPAITVEEADRQATRLATARLASSGVGAAGRKLTDEEGLRVVEDAKKIAADYKEITPDQIDGLDTLGIAAASGDERAIADLRAVAKSGQTPKIREYAAAKIPAKKTPAAVDTAAEGKLGAALSINVPSGDGKAAQRRFDEILGSVKGLSAEARTALAARLRAKRKGDQLAAEFQRRLSTASRERVLAELQSGGE